MAETAAATATAMVSGERLTALFVLAVGPVAGPWLLIVAAAGSGALIGVSGVETASRVEALRLAVALMAMAIFLTGILASMLERMYGIPVNELIAPVAWIIGALGRRWRPILAGVGEWIGSAFGGGRK